MNDEHTIHDSIELKTNCESVGIMITALIVQNDLVHNNRINKARALLAVKLINKIANEVNKSLR